MGKRAYDPEVAKQHTKDAQQRLADEVDGLLAGSGWQDWLKAQSKFHQYSYGNVLLIAVQCPHATYVAGYQRWQELGRQVRKGEKAIRILAPRPWARSLEDEDGNAVTTSGVSFTTVAVFDYSQTDAIEGRKAFEPGTRPFTGVEKQGDHTECAETYAELVSWAEGEGITFLPGSETPGGAWGVFWPAKNAIAVVERNAPAMLGTLIHEIAHALTYQGVNKTHGYAAGEIVAESVGYIVCDWLGLDALVPSAEYVAHWAAQDIKSFKAGLTEIAQTAHRLIEVLAGALAPAQAEPDMEVAA